MNSGVTVTLTDSIKVAGNWVNNNGTLNGGAYRVSFTGANKTISGTTTTFPELRIEAGSIDTLKVNTNCTSLKLKGGSSSSYLVHSGTISLSVSGTVTLEQPTASSVTHGWYINAGSADVSGVITLGGASTTSSRVSSIAVTSGSLSANGGVSFTSNITAATQVISVSTGTLTFANALALNAGTLSISSTGTINFNGGLTFGSSNAPSFSTVSGSNLNFGGDVSATTTTLSLNSTSNSTFTNSANVTPNSSMTFGHVTIGNGKTVTFSTGSGTLSIAGNFVLNGTIAGTQPFTLSTASTTIDGTGSVTNTGTMTISNSRSLLSSANLSFAGTIALGSSITFTNNGTVTTSASGGITGGNSLSTWVNATNSALSVSGPVLSTGILTASANPNTITYNGTAQTIKVPSSSTYHHLILSGSGNKTAGGALTVNGDFTINGSSSFVGGTSLTHTFLGNWVVNTNAAAPFSYTTASTINFNTPGTPAATSLSGTTLSSIDLNNVTLNNTSGFSSSHDFSASGSVTVANGVTFAPSADIVVSGSGTLTGNGTVRVTRTSPSAEMNSQFTITTKTLTNLTVEYNGTAAQSISALTYGGLKINNANGVSLGGNVTVNGILTLQSGNISTSSNKVILGSSGSVSRTSGHVVGNLQKTVATGPSSLTYEVGDASNYSPVAVTFGNVATGGNLIAKVTATEHPNIASSTINPVRSVNRYWTLTNNGMVFDNYSATFNFVENDIDAGADANTFDVQHYNGSWSTATTGTRTSTSTQATGLTSFSDYAVGKPIVQYTINASAGSNGSITPSGNISVTEGASQSFTIAASTGYHIADVLVDGNSQGAISSYNFTNISDNHSISATFAIDQFTITVNAGANGSITPGTTTVNYGSNQSFSIAANVGYHIVDVLVDGNSQGAVASYNFANVTAAHTISATFAIDQFTITVNAGANGSITPGTTTVNYGSNQSFSIAANTGYHIVDVLIDAENSQGAVTSYDFTNVIANHTISATFAIDQFTITVSAGANGSITPGTTTVNYGSNQSFSIAANVGYHIVDVLVDGNSQGTAASYNFSNVTALHTISASFAIDTFTVTSSLIGSNGTISPLGSTTVNYGSSQFYTITPDTGYQVDSVIVDGSLVDSTTSYTFDNITANHTIAVNFKLLPIVDTVLYRTFKASTSDLGTTKAVKLKFKNGALTSGEPNMMTVLENTFARIGKTGTTFLGVPQTDKDSSKKYAWIFAKKAGDFAKYYSITHTGLGYPIDSFRQTGKKAKKLSKALKPDKKYNNQMWAEAMMLRLNILASQDSITPKGFGALVLDTAATLLGRNLEGQTLSSIASYLDSLMTYWERLGVNDTSLNITELSLFATDVIGRINNGFSTVMNASNYIIDTNGVTKGDSTLVGKKKNSYAVTLLGYVPAESVDIVRRVPGKTVEPFIPVVGFREVPGEYVLEQNFPNPFNPTTSIVFSLPEETEVTLKVYSILGQEIATLISNKYLDAGEHEITFDASNLSSGVYFYRMNFGDGTYSTMKKMLLLK